MTQNMIILKRRLAGPLEELMAVWSYLIVVSDRGPEEAAAWYPVMTHAGFLVQVAAAAADARLPPQGRTTTPPEADPNILRCVETTE